MPAAPAAARHVPPVARILAAVAVLALAAFHIRHLAFICDDAFIAFRYARNLVEGQGLVFNPGERVEGFTSLSWVLIIAAVMRAGGAPERWAPLIGAVSALATVAAVMIHLDRRAPWFGIVAGLLLASSASFAAWATGGLETGWFTLLVTLGFLLALAVLERGTRRLVVLDAALLALAVMTRPEALLIAAASFAAFALAAARGSLAPRRLALWLVVFAAPVGSLVAWRWGHYGHPWPNTFAVKAGGAAMLTTGLVYLGGAITRLHLELLAVPAAFAAALGTRARLPRHATPLIAGAVLPLVAFIVWLGGDFMDLYRFIVPVMPMLAWLAAAGLAAFGARLAPRTAWGPALALLIVAIVIGAWGGLNLRATRDTTRVWNRLGVDSIGLLREDARDWTLIGRFFASVAQGSDTLSTTAAGIIPYYSRLYTVDELGLVAADLTQYRRLASPRAGHGLAITGSALLRSRPQFMVGHPHVSGEAPRSANAVSVEPGWGHRIAPLYEPFRVALPTEPPRVFTFAVRRDVRGRLP